MVEYTGKYYCDICGKEIPPNYLENTIMIPEKIHLVGTGYAHKKCWKKVNKK